MALWPAVWTVSSGDGCPGEGSGWTSRRCIGPLEGVPCLERVRHKHPKVKVIMLSGSCEQAQIEAAFARGATAYIVKSVNPVGLASAIRQAFDQSVFHAVGSAP